MRRTEGLHQADLDWFAADAEGCLALLSGANALSVPPVILDNDSELDRLYEFFRDILQAEPEALAARGLFAYAAPEPRAAYRRVAVPERPLQVSLLPPQIRRVAARFTFPELHFSSATEITAAQVASPSG